MVFFFKSHKNSLFPGEYCKSNLHLPLNIKSCLKSLIGQRWILKLPAASQILDCHFDVHNKPHLCTEKTICKLQCRDVIQEISEYLFFVPPYILWANVVKGWQKSVERSCNCNCGKCDGCLLYVSHLHLHQHLLWQRTTPHRLYLLFNRFSSSEKERESASNLNFKSALFEFRFSY